MSDNGAPLTRDELAAEAWRLCEQRGYTRAEAAHALREHYKGEKEEPTTGWITRLVRDHKRAVAAQYGVREYTMRTGDENFTVNVPVFNGAPVLDWERCIIIGDAHLPTTDFALAETMLKIAQRLGIKKLLIAGDLINADAYSRYEHLVSPPTLAEESAVAVRFMARVGEVFDEHVLLRGNHEDRFLKRNGGNVSVGVLGALFSSARGKLRTTPYSYATVRSGGQVWRVTHQRNYSRIPGRVAERLAMKYGCNIISFHQHHVGVHMSSNGQWVLVDGGGLFDDEKMAYVQLTDSIMPRMARGFVVLEHGTASLVTPYPAMTNMRYWLGEETRV